MSVPYAFALTNAATLMDRSSARVDRDTNLLLTNDHVMMLMNVRGVECANTTAATFVGLTGAHVKWGIDCRVTVAPAEMLTSAHEDKKEPTAHGGVVTHPERSRASALEGIHLV